MNSTQYRTLRPGDTIQPGDEFKIILGEGWKPFTTNFGRVINEEDTPFRRPLRALPEEVRPEGLPSELPDPPPAPEGTRWVYRGKGWHCMSCIYIFHSGESWSDKTYGFCHGTASGIQNYHYLEAVPLEPVPAVWTFRSEEPVLPWGSSAELNGLRKRLREANAKVAELEACLVKTEKWSDTYAAESESLRQQLDSIRQLLASR